MARHDANLFVYLLYYYHPRIEISASLGLEESKVTYARAHRGVGCGESGISVWLCGTQLVFNSNII